MPRPTGCAAPGTVTAASSASIVATGIAIAISIPALGPSTWRSQAALGQLLPRLATGAAQARRAGTYPCGATCYLLGMSTRRMERLVESLGFTNLSKSQVSVTASELDEAVEAFRTRPLDAGSYTFVAADALVLKVRENSRLVGVHTLIATGVNADGYREILGVQVTSAQVTSAEDGASWLAFFRDLVARGLSGVGLVTSDAHPGLMAAIGAALLGTAWQRCRTHYTT